MLGFENTARDIILKKCLLYLGMRKAGEDKIKGMKANDEMNEVMRKFLEPNGNTPYLFAVPSSAESIKYQLEPPSGESIKKKILLVIRVRIPQKGQEVHIDESNVEEEVIIKEANKQTLENLYMICNEVYLPVLGNPLNVMDMSELVSKDLMDKFHIFLAHTYVTIGSVKGRTQLPLPPNDVTSSEKTSSKDKGSLLE
jgi:dynein heavy chain